MTLILTLDINDGMLFNSRRQTRDRAVYERILLKFTGRSIRMNEYSAPLFKDSVGLSISVGDFESIEADDVLFIENTPPERFAQKADKIIIYRWDKVYPSDLKADTTTLLRNFTNAENTEFKGFSHDKITEEIWYRNESK